MSYKVTNKIILNLVLALFTILPFLPILSLKFPIYRLGDKSLIGFTREVILLVVIAILTVVVLTRKTIKLDFFTIFLINYITYGILHVFISNVDFTLGVDKLRLVYLYPILILLLLLYNKRPNTIGDTAESSRKFAKIFLFQSLIILITIIFEFLFKEKFLIVFYGDYYNQMHINLLGQNNIRLVSILYNPINLGLFLNFTLVYLLFYNFKNRFIISMRWVLIAITVFGTFRTFSRICYVIMLTAFLIYFLAGRFNAKKVVIPIIMMLVLSVLVANSYFVSDIDLISKRLNQLSIEKITKDERFQNWSQYLDMTFKGGIYDYLWGYGLGSSNPNANVNNNAVKKVENSYVTMLGELGIIGLLMYIYLLYRFVSNAFIVRKFNVENSNFLLGILAIFIIGGVTNDIHQNNPFSFYFWLILFFSESQRRNYILCK